MSNAQLLSQRLELLKREDQRENGVLLQKKSVWQASKDQKTQLEDTIEEKTKAVKEKELEMGKLESEISKLESESKKLEQDKKDLTDQARQHKDSGKKIAMKHAIEAKELEIKKLNAEIAKLQDRVKAAEMVIQQTDFDIRKEETEEEAIIEKASRVHSSTNKSNLDRSFSTKKEQIKKIQAEEEQLRAEIKQLKLQPSVMVEKEKTTFSAISILEKTAAARKQEIIRVQTDYDAIIRGSSSQTKFRS